ncbi:MAG: SPFH domain-containing protein [Leptolyngbya sp.]|nr:SPFH domain-containing protein [Leptolyngbya sp.]
MTLAVTPASPDSKVYAKPTSDHVSLGGTIRGTLFWLPVILCFTLALWGVSPGNWQRRSPQLALAAIASLLWHQGVQGVRVAAEWEQGVILRLGKLHRIKAGGLFYVLPGVEYVRFIDRRTLVVNIPQQKTITRDNVPAVIDSALFFTVRDPGLAITTVQDFRFAIAQYTQAALRDVVGASTLDELLSERERIQQRIATAIDERVQSWGLTVDSLQLQDFELPEDLKRVMARQAAAEREKRAAITKAEGDRLAAVNLAEAATLMATNPMAMELRALQTLDALGNSPNNTIVLFPMALGQVLATVQSPRDPQGSA